MIERIERGWPGHFICANDCIYRRNTLLYNPETNQRIVISSVGNLRDRRKGKIQTIGHERYYETMIFEAKFESLYWEADVSKEIYTKLPCSIYAEDPRDLPQNVDNCMDQTHENIVDDIIKRMEKGVVI